MKISVFGAGLMGHALALVHALGGHAIRMTDNNPATLEKSLGLMQTALATLRDAGEVDASWTSERLEGRVTRCSTGADTLQGAEPILEALTQRPAAHVPLHPGLD